MSDDLFEWGEPLILCTDTSPNLRYVGPDPHARDNSVVVNAIGVPMTRPTRILRRNNIEVGDRVVGRHGPEEVPGRDLIIYFVHFVLGTKAAITVADTDDAELQLRHVSELRKVEQ